MDALSQSFSHLTVKVYYRLVGTTSLTVTGNPTRTPAPSGSCQWRIQRGCNGFSCNPLWKVCAPNQRWLVARRAMITLKYGQCVGLGVVLKTKLATESKKWLTGKYLQTQPDSTCPLHQRVTQAFDFHSNLALCAWLLLKLIIISSLQEKSIAVVVGCAGGKYHPRSDSNSCCS